MNRLLACSLFFLVATVSPLAAAFEYTGGAIGQWDILDLSPEPAEVHVVEDLSCPPGYGPEVMHIRGAVVLCMPKEQTLENGTIVALYKENDPAGEDADGVIMVWADYPMDIAQAHNLKERRAHLWLEQDNDVGLSYRCIDPNGEEISLAENPGEGLVTESWNRTNWIWQKVQIAGDKVRAKYWPAHLPEPNEWHLEAEYDSTRGLRYGLRINSGDVCVAYFAAAEGGDIEVMPPEAWLHFPAAKAVQTRRFPLVLFTNAGKASHETFNLTVNSDGLDPIALTFEADLFQGSSAFPMVMTTEPETASAGVTILKLPRELSEGKCTISMASPDSQISAERTFLIAPAEQLQKRIDNTLAASRDLRKSLNGMDSESDKASELRALADAAVFHTERAQRLLQDAQTEDASLSIRFAGEVFGELQGFKGAWLKELLPDYQLPAVEYDSGDRRRIETSKDGVRDFHSMAYQLRFGEPRLDAQSFVMGHKYVAEIPWTVEGTTPDRDFAFSVALKSPLGNRTVASSEAAPEVPTSQWMPGQTYVLSVPLDVLPEDTSDKYSFLSKPPVWEEYHRLVVNVTDPESGAHVMLANEPGLQPSLMHMDYVASDVYVALAPVEIRRFAPPDSAVLTQRKDTVQIHNVGDAAREVSLLFTVTASTGRVLTESLHHASVDARNMQTLSLNWMPDTAGPLTMRVQVLQDGIIQTEAKRDFAVSPPDGYALQVHKANHVERQDERFYTPVTVSAGTRPVSVTVHAAERLVGETSSDTGEVTVEAEPWFGYYDVSVDLGEFHYDRRIIATVVETGDTDLIVNGEPFLIKGTNVHGMDSQSPEYTAAMMRVMRDLGFNTWRGDYPARWQVDLAYELNTVYTVLAPFSCIETEAIFGRQEGPPMATSRELTRLFVQTYRDSAGVLLWNSANEVGGETPDFLWSQYPLYKHLDEYERPVHYANLYGQYYWQGQDAIGVNTYFGKGQHAVNRHPNVLQMLEVGREHGKPVFYCEFNSWWGAIQSSGAEAFRDLYVWGIEQGMAGGVQYEDNDTDRHPGIYDQGLNTHKIHNDAIREAFADARVRVADSSPEAITLEVVNKRRFHLRDVTLKASISGLPLEPVALADITPKGTEGGVQPVTLRIPESAAGPAHTVEGELTFVTHYGFRCRVPFRVVARMAQE